VGRLEAPCLRLITKEQVTVKYMPDSEELTENAIVQFVEDYYAGKLQPIYQSEKLPWDWDHRPLKILVGSNFETVAMDKSKTVLVGFC
jgi:protein disulfide-isomerase A1